VAVRVNWSLMRARHLTRRGAAPASERPIQADPELKTWDASDLLRRISQLKRIALSVCEL
jgi:hypothetical protein